MRSLPLLGLAGPGQHQFFSKEAVEAKSRRAPSIRYLSSTLWAFHLGSAWLCKVPQPRQRGQEEPCCSSSLHKGRAGRVFLTRHESGPAAGRALCCWPGSRGDSQELSLDLWFCLSIWAEFWMETGTPLPSLSHSDICPQLFGASFCSPRLLPPTTHSQPY